MNLYLYNNPELKILEIFYVFVKNNKSTLRKECAFV